MGRCAILNNLSFLTHTMNYEQSLSFRSVNATVFCNYHCEYGNFHDSTVGSRITIPSCHCNYWRLGNEPIELRRLQIRLTVGLVHVCHMCSGKSTRLQTNYLQVNFNILDVERINCPRTDTGCLLET